MQTKTITLKIPTITLPKFSFNLKARKEQKLRQMIRDEIEKSRHPHPPKKFQSRRKADV